MYVIFVAGCMEVIGVCQYIWYAHLQRRPRVTRLPGRSVNIICRFLFITVFSLTMTSICASAPLQTRLLTGLGTLCCVKNIDYFVLQNKFVVFRRAFSCNRKGSVNKRVISGGHDIVSRWREWSFVLQINNANGNRYWGYWQYNLDKVTLM